MSAAGLHACFCRPPAHGQGHSVSWFVPFAPTYMRCNIHRSLALASHMCLETFLMIFFPSNFLKFYKVKFITLSIYGCLRFASGEGNGNPLQCSCLENPRDGSLVGWHLWGCTESDTTEAT